MKPVLKSERGIALFLVLWVMALLTIIAGEFSYAIRTEAKIAGNFKEETQAYYIATSGAFTAIGELVANEFVPRPLSTAGSEEEPADVWRRYNVDIPAVPFGEGQFKVEKENESGKVNLNRAGGALLKMILNGFELDDAGKNVIVDSIMDWRDKDRLHRANGAEDEYYQSLPEPYRCKNGDFTSAEELLLVRGVTSGIYYGGLKEMVTVYQDKETPTPQGQKPAAGPDFNRININAASPQMLRSLPGMTEDIVEKIVEYRKKGDFRSLTELAVLVEADTYSAISRYITLNLSPYYTIKSVGSFRESKNRSGVRAVVKIDRTLSMGYVIINWVDALEQG